MQSAMITGGRRGVWCEVVNWMDIGKEGEQESEVKLRPGKGEERCFSLSVLNVCSS